MQQLNLKYYLRIEFQRNQFLIFLNIEKIIRYTYTRKYLPTIETTRACKNE